MIMEDPNLEGVQTVDFQSTSHCFRLDNETQFIQQISEIAQKKKSVMKSFCEQSNIEDQKCDEVAQYARIHSQANIFNSTSMMTYQKIKTNPKIEGCSCGCRRGVGEPLSIWINEQNLSFLGPGILLFFFYLKHVRMNLIFLLLSYGIFAIITNIISSENINMEVCLQKPTSIEELLCKLNLISTFHLKKNQIFRQFQLWMGLLVSLFWCVGIKFIQYLGNKKDKEIDELLDSASDYTIRVQNLPFGDFNQRELIEYIQQLWETRKEITIEELNKDIDECLELKSIQIIYDMSQCRKLISNIQNLSIKIEQLVQSQNYKESEIFQSLKSQIITHFQSLEKLRNKFSDNQLFRKQISTTCALIEFKNAHQQKLFLQKYSNKSTNFISNCCSPHTQQTFKGNQVIFSRAPEPSDFNWSNCQIRFSYLRYFLIWGITMLILYTAYALISYLQTTDFVKNSAGILISIILQLFNRIIWLSLSFLVTFQYNNTKTQFIISLMKKSIFAQLINVILTPIINMYVNNKPLFGEGSLSAMVLNYQFIMFFMMVFFYLLNPSYYFKKVMKCIPWLRNLIIRHLCEIVGQIDTIDEIRPVLTYYEGPQFPIAGAYVYMTTAIFHTLFYCHIQPFLLLIVIFNLTGFYLILKYMLFRRCKIPELTDVQIFDLAVSVICYGSAIFGIGNIFFIIIQNREDTILKVNMVELIPPFLCLSLNVIIWANPRNIIKRINIYLFNMFGFATDFNFGDDKKQDADVDEIVAEIFMSNLESKVSYQRKQSYYKNSNSHQLFNYQSQLKEIANEKSVYRTRALRLFCESFFHSNYPRENNRNSFNLNDDLMQMILIPAIQLKKNTKIQKKVSNSSSSSQKNFNHAKLIISQLFSNK